MAGPSLDTVKDISNAISDYLKGLDEKGMIEAINDIKKSMHSISPFKDEPVDCVLWVETGLVTANDYNPNSVAPPEMELLRLSIESDGYTQPVVAHEGPDGITVVDGFHRNRVARECETIKERVNGYIPVTIIRDSRGDRGDRIASTIRHNRARGKHSIDRMSDIVVELKKRNWSNDRIGKQLGMDQDEVLRLCQINNLEEAFKDRVFSEGWEYEPEDETEINLEKSWPSALRDAGREQGWQHPTEKYSYLIGNKSKRLGSIQKSRWDGEWFVYCYTSPIIETKEKTKDQAMQFVEAASSKRL